MEYRQLGRSGLKVSAIGLGCNNFGRRCNPDETRAVVAKALDAGITFFDTADIYGGGLSEEYLGAALGARRKDIVLATKFGVPMQPGEYNGGASRRYIVNAVEASLKRLGTDYIDLYQLHFPDPKTPMEETLSALDALVASGKVRYIGSSNLTGWQLADAMWISKTQNCAPYISAQNHYNLLTRRIELDLIPAAAHYGVGILPYFPLESGLLTGKYKRNAPAPNDSRLASADAQKRFMNDANWEIVEKLEAFVAERSHTMLELAFSWLLANPNVASVIAGATKPEQIEANVGAGGWKLGQDEKDAVAKITFRF